MEFETLPFRSMAGGKLSEAEAVTLLTNQLVGSEVLQFACGGTLGIKRCLIGLSDKRLLAVDPQGGSKLDLDIDLATVKTVKQAMGTVLEISALAGVKRLGIVDKVSATRLVAILQSNLAQSPVENSDPVESEESREAPEQVSKSLGETQTDLGEPLGIVELNLQPNLAQSLVENSDPVESEKSRKTRERVFRLMGYTQTDLGEPLGIVKGKKNEKIEVYKLGLKFLGQVHPLDKNLSAEVMLDGQLIVSHRPTVTRTIAAAAIPGAGTAIFGLASRKKVTDDTREAHFSVVHPDFRYVLAIDYKSVPAMKTLASQINAIATQLAGEAVDTASVPESISTNESKDAATRLREVKALLEEGLISESEASELRAAIIGNV